MRLDRQHSNPLPANSFSGNVEASGGGARVLEGEVYPGLGVHPIEATSNLPEATIRWPRRCSQLMRHDRTMVFGLHEDGQLDKFRKGARK
jgi:hypothetical protein